MYEIVVSGLAKGIVRAGYLNKRAYKKKFAVLKRIQNCELFSCKNVINHVFLYMIYVMKMEMIKNKNFSIW